MYLAHMRGEGGRSDRASQQDRARLCMGVRELIRGFVRALFAARKDARSSSRAPGRNSATVYPPRQVALWLFLPGIPLVTMLSITWWSGTGVWEALPASMHGLLQLAQCGCFLLWPLVLIMALRAYLAQYRVRRRLVGLVRLARALFVEAGAWCVGGALGLLEGAAIRAVDPIAEWLMLIFVVGTPFVIYVVWWQKLFGIGSRAVLLELLEGQYGQYQQDHLIPNSSAVLKGYARTLAQISPNIDAEQTWLVGSPGAGKTAQLHDLAIDLAHRAQQGDNDRLPIILDLSQWMPAADSFEYWLIEAVTQTYQVQRRLVARWIKQHQILVLLDGLDQVPKVDRIGCLRQIEQYFSGGGPCVICCRQESLPLAKEFTTLRKVELPPLSAAEVLAILASKGSSVDALRTAVTTDAGMQELLRCTALLCAATFGFELLKSADPPPASGERTAWRRYLCRCFVACMLATPEQRGQKRPPWRTADGVHKAFAWLGHHLRTHETPTFYVEELQNDSLPTSSSRRTYYSVQVAANVVSKGGLIALLGLVVVLAVATAYSIAGGQVPRTLFGTVGAVQASDTVLVTIGIISFVPLMIGARNYLHPNRSISFVDRLAIEPRHAGRAATVAVVAAMPVGTILGLSALATVGATAGVGVGISSGIAVGLALGVSIGLVDVLRRVELDPADLYVPGEGSRSGGLAQRCSIDA
jgi:hypothetical protein